AEQQRKRVTAEVDKDSRLKAIVKHLESHYESRFRAAEREEQPRLSPEIERFLREMDKRFEGN
ncbi:MAG: hypothetical protein AB1603_06855, partial [Chloroflexota bacterium]